MQLMYDAPAPQKVTAISDASSLRMEVCGTVAGSPANVLIDTGASLQYINQGFARLLGLHVQPCAEKTDIQAYDGRTVAAIGECRVKMNLGHWGLIR